jgi:hypothetical protein
VGAHLTFGTKGNRATIGLPGTGMYWTEQIGKTPPQSPPPLGQPVTPFRIAPGIIVLALIVLALAALAH